LCYGGYSPFTNALRDRRGEVLENLLDSDVFFAKTGAHPGAPSLDLAAPGSDLAGLGTLPCERERRSRRTGARSSRPERSSRRGER